jgi:ribosome modulation factor
MTHTADVAAFRLSRIYAQGWNTAMTAKSAEHANPYPADPERGRWQAGFADARQVAEK